MEAYVAPYVQVRHAIHLLYATSPRSRDGADHDRDSHTPAGRLNGQRHAPVQSPGEADPSAHGHLRSRPMATSYGDESPFRQARERDAARIARLWLRAMRAAAAGAPPVLGGLMSV